MISRPWRTRAAICRHHWPTACSSSPRPSLVTRLEPTLTTMRRASHKTEDEFMAAIKQVKRQILKPGANASGRHGADTRQRTRRRESKTPACPAILGPKTQMHDRFHRDDGLNAERYLQGDPIGFVSIRAGGVAFLDIAWQDKYRVPTGHFLNDEKRF